MPSRDDHDHDRSPHDDHPRLGVGQVGVLRVADVNPTGVFLDQGLAKQLLLPHNELHAPVRPGDRVVVFVLEDAQGRPYASNQLTKHLSFTPRGLTAGTQVRLLVYSQNERGFLCVVDGRYAGMLFRDRTHEQLRVGDELDGFVTEVQPSGKLDLALRKPGVDPFVEDLARVEARLKADGFLDLHDKSPAPLIRKRLGISKKSFKRALGALYKKRRIALEEGGVRWLGDEG